MHFCEAPKAHPSREDAETDVLASTPPGIDGWYFDPRKSQLRNGAKGRCCDATLDNADEVIKAIKYACCNGVGNTNWSVIANLVEQMQVSYPKFIVESIMITHSEQKNKRSQCMRYHKEIIRFGPDKTSGANPEEINTD